MVSIFKSKKNHKMGPNELCTVDEANSFLMIRLELKTSVNDMNVTLVCTVTSCDVTTVQQHYKGSTSTSTLYQDLNHCFIVFKHIQQSVLMRRVDVNRKINIVQIIDHSQILLAFVHRVRWRTKRHVSSFSGHPVLYGSDSCSQELQRSDPTSQEREYHVTYILHPKK